ncbi:hypothetical protein KVY11_01140 [Acinetobacter sp. CWB-G5]|uniref:hypothetical protein n=1 Tax=Acinetobacter sp. CWB-G5 TaxID=2855444 RepID=UPI001C48B5C5|nr:hypothetical protein [Acinetobacter sp. CWB-G5]MBV7307301.1 hypothetical protein [Acinetobacter sp. CWB-G5]
MQETFKAGTHYGDYKGTITADDADLSTLLFAMRAKLNIAEKEHIVGYTFQANYKLRTTEIESISVIVYLNNDSNLKEKVENFETIDVKKVTGEISISEFFGLFKELEICLSTKGILDGASLNIIN